MKKCSIALVLYVVLLCAVYCMSYYAAYVDTKEDFKKQMSDEPDMLETSVAQKQIVKEDTQYIIEVMDQTKSTVTYISELVPRELLGFGREKTELYAKAYSEHPSIEDCERGFLTMELITFSDEKIIFRKIYKPYEKNYKYYLKEQEDKVIVYYMDEKTIFEYTDIVCETLPLELKKNIYQGNYKVTIEELYDFLENYSS